MIRGNSSTPKQAKLGTLRKRSSNYRVSCLLGVTFYNSLPYLNRFKNKGGRGTAVESTIIILRKSILNVNKTISKAEIGC